MRWRIYLFVCTLLVPTAGCAVTGVHNDQANLRTALVTLCSNQVMDNLVRASNGLPIIHLDYTNGNTQMTLDVNASLSETAGNTRSNALTALGMSSVLVIRTFSNTIAGSLGMSRVNQVGVTATPVTTNNQLYDAYLSFLTIPGSLVVTDCPPPDGAAHVCQQFRDQYYWVPIEFRDRYFELAMITTAQRGKTLLPLDDFYSVSLVGFGAPGQAELEPTDGATTVIVEADREIPTQGGGQAWLNGAGPFRIMEDDSDEEEQIDYVSKKFKLVLEKTVDPQFGDPKALVFPIQARLKLRQKPPPPTTRELLERIPFRTPQVSLNAPATVVPKQPGTGRPATKQAYEDQADVPEPK